LFLLGAHRHISSYAITDYTPDSAKRFHRFVEEAAGSFPYLVLTQRILGVITHAEVGEYRSCRALVQRRHEEKGPLSRASFVFAMCLGSYVPGEAFRSTMTSFASKQPSGSAED
jgi:hypothetical protein